MIDPDVHGLVTMRQREIERRNVSLPPFTTTTACPRCGEKIVLTPAQQRFQRETGKTAWCYECVEELHPEGIGYVTSLGMVIEQIEHHYRLYHAPTAGGIH